jgi:hypothetical protein
MAKKNKTVKELALDFEVLSEKVKKLEDVAEKKIMKWKASCVRFVMNMLNARMI